MSMLEWLDISILILCTLVIIIALNKCLILQDKVVKRTVWKMLLPCYVIILLFGIVDLFAHQPVLILIRDIALTLFLYVGLLNGVLVLHLESKRQTMFNETKKVSLSVVEGE